MSKAENIIAVFLFFFKPRIKLVGGNRPTAKGEQSIFPLSCKREGRTREKNTGAVK